MLSLTIDVVRTAGLLVLRPPALAPTLPALLWEGRAGKRVEGGRARQARGRRRLRRPAWFPAPAGGAGPTAKTTTTTAATTQHHQKHRTVAN